MSIYTDDRSEYLIEKKEPQRYTVPPNYEGVLIGDTPPIVKTKILNGVASYYDPSDALVYQHPMEKTILPIMLSGTLPLCYQAL